MKIDTAQKTLMNMRSKISFQNVIISGLVFCLVCLSYKVGIKDKMVVMMPMQVTEKMEVGYSNASATYFKPVAFQLVSMISSITPENADYWHKVLEPYFEPEVWSWLGPQILEIKTRPQITASSTYSFFRPSAKAIEYEPATNTIFINGKVTSSAFNDQGNEQRLASVDTTYEVRMKMVNGFPKVTFWRLYTGQPMTQKWIQQNPSLAEKREKDIKKQAALVIPKPKVAEIIYEDAPVAAPISAAASAPTNVPNTPSKEPNAIPSQIREGILPPSEGASAAEIQPSSDDQL